MQRHVPTDAQWRVERNALGGSRGGFSTNLHAVVDTKSRPIRVALTPGVIHARPERKVKPRLARKLYRGRYLVEVFFHSLMRFRAIAIRYDKSARNYLALVQLASMARQLGTLPRRPRKTKRYFVQVAATAPFFARHVMTALLQFPVPFWASFQAASTPPMHVHSLQPAGSGAHVDADRLKPPSINVIPV